MVSLPLPVLPQTSFSSIISCQFCSVLVAEAAICTPLEWSFFTHPVIHTSSKLIYHLEIEFTTNIYFSLAHKLQLIKWKSVHNNIFLFVIHLKVICSWNLQQSLMSYIYLVKTSHFSWLTKLIVAFLILIRRGQSFSPYKAQQLSSIKSTAGFSMVLQGRKIGIIFFICIFPTWDTEAIIIPT